MRSLLALALKVILVPVVSVLSPSAADAPVAIIQTVAGNGTSAFSGDNGAATTASLSEPFGVAADAIGSDKLAVVAAPLSPEKADVPLPATVWIIATGASAALGDSTLTTGTRITFRAKASSDLIGPTKC